MIRIRQVKLPISSDELSKKVAKILNISLDDIIKIRIVKKSIDAREKKNLLFVYELDVEVKNEQKTLRRCHSKDILLSPSEEYKFVISNKTTSKERPIIVGSGPAGLYCAYLLAEHGFNPLIIERGEKVEDRVKTIEEFWQNNKLNPESNVQFGEGGAGTFSDGKLNTSIKDKENRIKKVLEIFVENGAPEEILYEAKPHIGTDILRVVIKNIRERILNWGGEIRYNTKLTNIEINNNKVTSIEVNNIIKIPCNILV